jgi:hypothetical protein
MPTVAELQNLADELKIHYKKSYTKKKLIEILGPKNVNSLDYTKDIRELKEKKGLIHKESIFEIKSVYKTDNVIVFTLVKDYNIIVVRGILSGKGLGAGGGKWNYSKHVLK